MYVVVIDKDDGRYSVYSSLDHLYQVDYSVTKSDRYYKVRWLLQSY